MPVDNRDQFDSLKKEIKQGKRYGVEGMLISSSGLKRGVRGKIHTAEYHFIVNKYFPYKDDTSFIMKNAMKWNKPDDLAVLWDFENNNNPWDFEETLIYLLAL